MSCLRYICTFVTINQNGIERLVKTGKWWTHLTIFVNLITLEKLNSIIYYVNTRKKITRCKKKNNRFSRLAWLSKLNYCVLAWKSFFFAIISDANLHLINSPKIRFACQALKDPLPSQIKIIDPSRLLYRIFFACTRCFSQKVYLTCLHAWAGYRGWPPDCEFFQHLCFKFGELFLKQLVINICSSSEQNAKVHLL